MSRKSRVKALFSFPSSSTNRNPVEIKKIYSIPRNSLPNQDGNGNTISSRKKKRLQVVTVRRKHPPPLKEVEIRKPRILWVFAILDVVLAFVNGNQVQEKNESSTTSKGVLYYVGVCYFIVQFVTGATLFFGLLSRKEATISNWLNAWILGALLLFLGDTFFYVWKLTHFATIEWDEEVSMYLLAQIFGTFTLFLVRLLTFFMVTNVLYDETDEASQVKDKDKNESKRNQQYYD